MTRNQMPSAQLARFLAKVSIDPDTECWEWTAAMSADGYGIFSRDAQSSRLAHRISFEHFRHTLLPYPQQVADHECRNRRCVNPQHLRAVTQQENTLAPGSLSVAARRASQTHCVRGHELSGDNLYPPTKSSPTRRVCRACKKINNAAR